MRALLIAMLCASQAEAAISESSPEQKPQHVVLRFDADAEATLDLMNAQITRIALGIGHSRAAISLTNCAQPLTDVRLDSVVLIRGDRDSREPSSSLTLLFDAGLESERAFGRLPRVQLTLSDGKFVEALVSRQIAENHGFSFPLCLAKEPPSAPTCARPAPLETLGVSSGPVIVVTLKSDVAHPDAAIALLAKGAGFDVVHSSAPRTYLVVTGLHPIDVLDGLRCEAQVEGVKYGSLARVAN